MIRPNQISVVLQGPTYPEIGEAVASIRLHLPGAELILSTWQDTNLDVDCTLVNLDPGTNGQLQWDGKLNNGNRMLVSSLSGIRAASNPFTLRLRTDAKIGHTRFLKYFSRYADDPGELKYFKKKIVVSAYFTTNVRMIPYPYHVSDWFHFGTTQDLLTLFSAPLIDDPVNSAYFVNPRNRFKHFYSSLQPEMPVQFTPEQHLWTEFLRKHVELDFRHYKHATAENVFLTEQSIASNCIILEPERAGLLLPKYTRTLEDGHMRSLHTNYTQWLRLCQRYDSVRLLKS